VLAQARYKTALASVSNHAAAQACDRKDPILTATSQPLHETAKLFSQMFRCPDTADLAAAYDPESYNGYAKLTEPQSAAQIHAHSPQVWCIASRLDPESADPGANSQSDRIQACTKSAKACPAMPGYARDIQLSPRPPDPINLQQDPDPIVPKPPMNCLKTDLMSQEALVLLLQRH
jgi:hypothetical protein